MDQNSQINFLESQVRECYARVVWTHKIQEKCSDILINRNNNLKYVQIFLSALTTTGLLVNIFDQNKCINIISAILSALLFALNLYNRSYDLGSIAQKHSEAAINIWNIREKYFSLLTEIKLKSFSEIDLIKKRDELQEELFNIYKGSPRSINSAYKDATKALKVSEELTFSDEEIDKFLPLHFRK
jgi:hypothetical protein